MNNCDIGLNVEIHPITNIYRSKIGDNTKIGPFVEIQKNTIIGKNCKIQSHSFICEGVEIEDNVFIGHGVMFCNDRHPSSVNINGELKSSKDWTLEKVRVKNGASIGTNSTILCGVTIGTNSLIGAGSVVTKNIPDNEIWIGNPARFLRKNEN
jgi:UDP-2-acetamido-3-amino-2,3-dideoxy-glucuronate N-acetyltransferase